MAGRYLALQYPFLRMLLFVHGFYISNIWMHMLPLEIIDVIGRYKDDSTKPNINKTSWVPPRRTYVVLIKNLNYAICKCQVCKRAS